LPLDDLDEGLRRSDPDRWLASRFVADPLARADLIALWSFDHELGRAERASSNPLIAEIRLAWWREALDEIFDGRVVRRHPTAQALSEAVVRRNLDRSLLQTMIDGRVEVLGLGVLNLEQATLWARAVGGQGAVLAARILDPDAPSEAAAPAGELWGMLCLRRSGRANGVDLDHWIKALLKAATRAARDVTPAAYPAIVCATLARGKHRTGEMSSLERRARLVWSVMIGRL
jgi:phytoene synthase